MLSNFDEKDVMPTANSDLTQTFGPYIGYLVAGATATWGVLLKWALGRYARVFDDIRNDMAGLKRESAEMKTDINGIKVDVGMIKGRFTERDHA